MKLELWKTIRLGAGVTKEELSGIALMCYHLQGEFTFTIECATEEMATELACLVFVDHDCPCDVDGVLVRVNQE